jgi:hypothetical protein
MKAGFFETDITPSIGMERPATYHKLFHTAIHDPLKVRACVLDCGGEKLAIVGVDTCLIQSGTVLKARASVKRSCGIPEKNIMIAASHTHAGGSLWGFCTEELKDAPKLIRRLALEESICLDVGYEKHVIDQIMTAVCMADKRKQPVKLSIGRGFEGQEVFNRRFRLKNGRVATHPGKGNSEIIEPAGPIDPEVGVISAWNDNDELIGCIVNYACHATCYGAGVSADWIYYMEKTIQSVMGKQANVVFLNGACGDVTQVDNQSLRPMELGDKWSRMLGTRVGAEAVKVMVTAEKGKEFKLAVLTDEIEVAIRKPSDESIAKCRKICEQMISRPDKTTEFHFSKERLILDYKLSNSDTFTVEIQAMQIGPAVLLANPSEYFCQFGMDIKKKSRFPFTFVIELANDCCGYVPTEDAFDPKHGGGYETVLTAGSNLEVKAGRKIMDKSLELAGRLVPGEVPKGEQVKSSNKVWDFGALGPELE